MRRRGTRGESRQRVLNAAATLYRQRGFSGVGIIEIANAAGMTHGGFYAQFPQGKEELITASVEQAFREGLQDWDEWIEIFTDGRALMQITEDYLSSRHYSNPEVGCPVAALAADVSRQGPMIKSMFTRRVKAQLSALGKLYPDSTPQERRSNAIKLLTRLAGTILIARAIDDPALTHELLATARQPELPLETR
ncbi:TetR/AcrR family transcriptional regulator [Pseudomonas fluorescens]|uniref:TetR/AcrR family transcriptional regulator n=1 Tax=Pseudomonas fluorescens TaxID=294 RepID=UPI00382094B3